MEMKRFEKTCLVPCHHHCHHKRYFNQGSLLLIPETQPGWVRWKGRRELGKDDLVAKMSRVDRCTIALEE
jgi:hypothetical protein